MKGMIVRLQVTSFQSRSMGESSAKDFNELGGSIGRANGNDWVLPDPERFISGRHALIEYINGDFYLVDTSSNGVLYNEQTMPLGRDKRVKLSDGDRLIIGEYQIQVQLSQQLNTEGVEGRSDTDEPVAPATPLTPKPSPQLDIDSSPMMGSIEDQSDISTLDTLDPLELFSSTEGKASRQEAASVDGLDGLPSAAQYDLVHPGQSQSDHAAMEHFSFEPPSAKAVDAAIVPPSNPVESLGSQETAVTGYADGHNIEIPENWDLLDDTEPFPPRQPVSAPSPAVEAPPLQSAIPAPAGKLRPPAEGDVGVTSGTQRDSMDEARRVLVTELLQETGLTPEQVDESVITFMAQLLPLVIKNLMELLRSRAEIKGEFRVSATQLMPTENNPLKFSVNVNDALLHLFINPTEGYMAPLDTVREGFEDVKAHQVAMLVGMRAAFRFMLKRFDPEQLEARFDGVHGKGSLLGIMGKHKYWDVYKENYAELSKDSETNFQQLFGDEFGRAYEEHMIQLAQQRKNKL